MLARREAPRHKVKRLPNDTEYLEQLKPFEHAMRESVARGERFNPEGFWAAALDPKHASLNAPEFFVSGGKSYAGSKRSADTRADRCANADAQDHFECGESNRLAQSVPADVAA